MTIPFEPIIFGVKVNIHLIFEYLAFFIAFRYYIRLRRLSIDPISNKNRLSIILGAIVGAFLGSRIVGFLENPIFTSNTNVLLFVLNTKSIIGGLLGGLIGVEFTKKIIKEKHSSGDLFTFPLVIGIIIGRIGCFLAGVKEFTYGRETSFFTGLDLGDGLYRHPISLYEVIFLVFLFACLKWITPFAKKDKGFLFKIFMISYFGFRFIIEFLKPNVFFILGLSSIQWLCILCWVYYFPTIKIIIGNARQKLYILRLHS